MSGRGLIEAQGLTKRFGDLTAVDAIDFDVRPGETFGFLGPTLLPTCYQRRRRIEPVRRLGDPPVRECACSH